MKTKANLITTPSRPGELLKTQWGTICYGDWCCREAERITNSGKSASVVVLDGGLVAVARV